LWTWAAKHDFEYMEQGLRPHCEKFIYYRLMMKDGLEDMMTEGVSMKVLSEIVGQCVKAKVKLNRQERRSRFLESITSEKIYRGSVYF